MTVDPATRPPLDPARLAGSPLPIQVAEQVPSTNAVVADLARAGSAPLVLVAEDQTAGRGRLDRTWDTPPRAALTFSVLLRPSVSPADWPWLPLLAGLAVREALPVGSDLKWPNDVLIGERKVCGILVERVESPIGPAAVIGIGINVSTTAEELPVPTATSLLLEGAAVDRTGLLLEVVASVQELMATWAADGTPWLRTAYRSACSTLGREVRVDLPAGAVLQGRAADIDGEGRLVVEGPDGLVPVSAGDVAHVRPPEG